MTAPATRASLRADLLLVLPAWVVARAVVLGADALVGFLARKAPALESLGLLGWDADYYRAITAAGYGDPTSDAFRFFPLTPLLARGLSLTGLPTAAALLVVVQVAALAFAVLVVRVARREGCPEPVVRRLPWLLQLLPPAVVLVMGYGEAVAGALAAAALLSLRNRRWWWAAGIGVLAGLARPTGLLLALPAAVEALRGLRSCGWPERLARAAAVAGPAIGCGAYLAYSAAVTGSALRPFTLQQATTLRGPVRNPLDTLGAALAGLPGGHLGTAAHLPSLALGVLLVLVVARRLPASYALWCAASAALVLVGSNLDSAERYLWAAFPLVLAAVWVIGDRVVLWWSALSLSVALLTADTVLIFTGSAVP